MRGLWKYISPFAPDQSGAAAVLYGLGGLVVVCDAGGCAGNICGFDEPRWFTGAPSAAFSAGLRDMDAILGRDDRLVDKLCAAAAQIAAPFAAIIGTPVPAVIATDYQALRRLAEKRLSLPVVTIETKGTERYDTGASMAYEGLCRRFARKELARQRGRLNVLGALPLDTGCTEYTFLQEFLRHTGWQDVRIFGTHGLTDYETAGAAEKNLVLAPAGLAAARYLEEAFGTPYVVAYPVLPKVEKLPHDVTGKRILIVHQQVLANEVRRHLKGADVTVATWFLLQADLAQDGDCHLQEEDDFIQLADNDRFDIIIGDEFLRRALPHFHGTFIDLPHFAVSGRCCAYD